MPSLIMMMNCKCKCKCTVGTAGAAGRAYLRVAAGAELEGVDQTGLTLRGAAAHARRALKVRRLHTKPITARVRLAACAVVKWFRGGCRANAVWRSTSHAVTPGDACEATCPVPTL